MQVLDLKQIKPRILEVYHMHSGSSVSYPHQMSLSFSRWFRRHHDIMDHDRAFRSFGYQTSFKHHIRSRCSVWHPSKEVFYGHMVRLRDVLAVPIWGHKGPHIVHRTQHSEEFRSLWLLRLTDSNHVDQVMIIFLHQQVDIRTHWPFSTASVCGQIPNVAKEYYNCKPRPN